MFEEISRYQVLSNDLSKGIQITKGTCSLMGGIFLCILEYFLTSSFSRLAAFSSISFSSEFTLSSAFLVFLDILWMETKIEHELALFSLEGAQNDCADLKYL